MPSIRSEVLNLKSPSLRKDLIDYSRSPERKKALAAQFRFSDFIERTKAGIPLEQKEIFGFVNKVTSKEIQDVQTTAWLMAVRMRNENKPLTIEETTNLTLAMAASGDILDLSEFGHVVDKHSSGGVGDKTTLVVGPIVAACGLTVAKMSGRGLGITGGTLDKMEAIPDMKGKVPGLNVKLTEEEFRRQAKEIGIVITGQTGTMAPADGILYALRDITGTVDSIPLIAASIMSKKIASGSTDLVLDVKVGKGAFMKTEEEALKLAKTMVEIGKKVGINVVAEITNMDQPLGEAVGNALEIVEAIRILKGEKKPDDFREHCIETASRMLIISGVAGNMNEAYLMVMRTIDEGTALEKFKQMIKAQGGNDQVIDSPELMTIEKEYPVIYEEEESIYIADVNAETIGEAVRDLGGGRIKSKEEKINHAVGMKVKAKVGRTINYGESLGSVYCDDPAKAEAAIQSLKNAVTFSNQFVETPKITRGTYPAVI
ncbi:MAG: thymidine phosphorylase [Patescibacteria group bacterium]|jgi:pyrimidine-nucleoside phosphorylase